MGHNYQKTWETYTSSWKAKTANAKRALFEKCLDPKNIYTDPLAKATTWDDLIAYMLDFHQQIPGGHFVTTYFQAHNNKSIARWEMKNGDGVIMGDGISYAEYNDEGRITSETGFFESPESS